MDRATVVLTPAQRIGIDALCGKVTVSVWANADGVCVCDGPSVWVLDEDGTATLISSEDEA